MLIQGTSITATYSRIDGIKRAYYNHEDKLKDFFNEATVLPVPDEAAAEIPRIIIKTLHEHAQLNISPVAATFEVHYDNGFERDWNNCSDYIKKRMKTVFEFLNTLTNNNYEYIGVVSNLIYDEVSEDGAKKIVNTLLNAGKISNIYDVNVKYTFVENNNYYVNIMLQNARLFNEGMDINHAGSLCIKNQVAESIGAVIDINDRYSFNTNVDYKSDCGKLEILLDSMSNIINNKLHALIEKGEY